MKGIIFLLIISIIIFVFELKSLQKESKKKYIWTNLVILLLNLLIFSILQFYSLSITTILITIFRPLVNIFFS
jgi:hypothetical protein